MKKIDWCCLQRDGIKLVEPNVNLSKKYIGEADKDLIEMKNASSLKWKDIEAYYSCYNSIYAILQKIGIRCEIHDCTLEFLRIVSEDLGITKEELNLIKDLKKKRIDVQYHLKEPEEIDEKSIAGFVLSCKNILNNLNEDRIKEMRIKLRELIEKSPPLENERK